MVAVVFWLALRGRKSLIIIESNSSLLDYDDCNYEEARSKRENMLHSCIIFALAANDNKHLLYLCIRYV